MVTVTTVYVVVAVAALGAQPWRDFEGQEAGLATILDRVTSAHYWGTVLAAGAVISIFSVTLVVPTGRPESCSPWAGTVSCPPLFAKVHPTRMTGGEQHRHRRGGGGSILAGFVAELSG